MYDDDESDEDIEVEQGGAPASGGYGNFADDTDDEEEEWEDKEALRREGAEISRGKEERAFYDNLAKKEDERHNAMRKDYAKRALVAGELRQKLRHKQLEIDAIGAKIQAEEDLIAYEQKKAYREGSLAISAETETNIVEDASMQLKAKREEEATSEFSVERALMHVKNLKEERSLLEKELKEKQEILHDEERALSQLQHTILRM